MPAMWSEKCGTCRGTTSTRNAPDRHSVWPALSGYTDRDAIYLLFIIQCLTYIFKTRNPFHRIVVLVVLLALAGSSWGATGQEAGAGSKMNVLFLASDDMRPQLGGYGDPVVRSPNLDALAAHGVVFTRAYSQQALCSPSRISLLTGRYPTTTQIFTIGPALREKLPDVVTLPQHFKNNGYFTRSLGKIYHDG